MSSVQTRPTDEELIRAFRAGDDGAFDRWVERHMKRIYSLAYRLTGNHDDADDLAQETFIRAHRGLARFRGDSRPSTWLTRILLNLARGTRPAHLPLGALPEPVAAGPPPSERLVRIEQRRQVREAIAGLPDRQRETLVLRLFEELRFKEIAEITGTSPGTARANFFHAMKSLARRLAPENGS